jgi:hypothetical protein
MSNGKVKEVLYGTDGRVIKPLYANKQKVLVEMTSMNTMNSDTTELARDFEDVDNSDVTADGIAKMVKDFDEHEEIFHFKSRRIVVSMSSLPEHLYKRVNNYLNGAPSEKKGLAYFTPTGNKIISFDDNYSENKADQEHFI